MSWTHGSYKTWGEYLGGDGSAKGAVSTYKEPVWKILLLINRTME